MDNDAVSDFLDAQREQTPQDLQHYFITFPDYWERKLWHELTDVLVAFFNEPQSGPQRLLLFNKFIKAFADKINQLQLVTLGLSAASQCPSDQERLAFLEKLQEQVDDPSSADAHVYAKVAVASVKLRLKDTEGARQDLDKAESVLDSFDSVETIVHASFYRVNSDYYQTQQEFASYYKNALLYLACVEVEDIPSAERQSRAYDLSIAALVSDTIYNFGELLLHPILDSLKGTPHAWLRELLFAFNRGDLRGFEALAGNISKNELLREHQTFLHQKISLSALTEAVFRRPPHDRSMNFATIRDETNVQQDEIEHLIMKALSLGLLRGTIDQVAQVANINWVQPKVLDMKQIEGMRTRLREWDSSVNQLGTWMESVGKDVWAA
ncbi:hypothetical protein FH972_025510 [Carpinus fangiana]|uniref:PCI domain-containing protein n=1 Tax=Carpinus fangiana TaxID=176857 RepID=A0A5N6L188_9ROSI|nr:hypothetical protein FH972_025510 [Carpinus fangiana]